MSFKTEFKKLVKKLAEDPDLRQAINTLNFGGKTGFAALPQGLVQAVLFAGKFVGKRRATSIANFIDAAVFLVSLSLMIKRNVFDRPEVQQFLAKTWKDIGRTSQQLTQVVRDYVDARLKAARRRR